MPSQKDVRHSGRRALERVLALRDEIKLQAHLLNKDAQRELTKLEAQVTVLEQRAQREGEQAFETLKTSLHELSRSLNDFTTTHVSGSLGLLTSVRSLMTTHVRTCAPDDSLNLAAHLMWNDDFGIVPVVSHEHQLVGVLTDRDVCMATYIQGRGPAELRVDGAMSKDVSSCALDDSIGVALGIMAERRVRRLPVLSSDGKLAGLLSLADIARWAASVTHPAVDAALTETLAAISARGLPRLVGSAE